MISPKLWMFVNCCAFVTISWFICDVSGKAIKISLPNFGSKIINGNEATRHQFPYLVSIQYLSHTTHDHEKTVLFHIPFCGGTILDERTILTAGHCFGQDLPPCPSYEKHCFRVVAGEHHLELEEHTEQLSYFPLTAVNRHEGYDGFHFDNDIAIIHLEEPLKFNSYVQPLALVDPEKSYNPTDATIMGWGKSTTNLYETTLTTAKVSIFSDDVCNTVWGDDYHNSVMMCAGGNDIQNGLVADACYGDSGGPLVATDKNNPDEKYIVGIVSWGFLCGERDYPGLYTRVETFLPWIAENRNKQ